MFAGIRAVEPATTVTYRAGVLTARQYWQVTCSNRSTTDEGAAREELDHLVGRAVTGALVADVPVGVLLSGGVDSSAIAVYASRAGARVRAFSVAHDVPGRPDPDFARARQVSARLRLSHQEIPFAALNLTRLPSIIERYGQPFNVFPMLYADQLARGVREHVTVALGGNGADELFGGYRGYNRHLLLDRTASLVAHLPRSLLARLPVAADRLLRLRAAASVPIEERRGRALNELANQLAAALFTPEFTTRTKDFQPGDRLTRYVRQCEPSEYLDAVLYSDLMLYHQHGTTVITDVSGMAHSLEIRAPLLDHRLIEFVFSMPRRLKVPSAFRANRNKYILKRLLEPALPREVLYGRKYGFGYNINFADFLAGDWSGAVERFVRRGRYLELGIFSEKGAAWAIAHAPAEVWRLLVFSIWTELFVFGSTADAVAASLADSLASDARRVA
jgi:asparagine synthase (glutamine-hydrolysing)